jgi:small-conductance mechanosensitive channel
LIYGLYELLGWLSRQAIYRVDFSTYVGFIALIWGCVVLIKTLRIFAFEYLFLTSMRAGVPLLLTNILTLALSIVMGGWVMTRFLQVDLTPLLATSAVFSLVLGLALQDTLGNLFAAVALQIDKPFELGDWIELKNGTEKISGQVLEVTWRATLLSAVTDELITIPNRTLAQWQVSNFSGRKRPFVRSHMFRLPYDESIDTAKAILLSAASSVPGVVANPPPVVIATESTESWVTLKVVYNINDYGSQFGIADRFITRAVGALGAAGIRLATQRVALEDVSDARSFTRNGR